MASTIAKISIFFVLLFVLAIILLPWQVWVVLAILAALFVAALFFPPTAAILWPLLGAAAEAGMTVAEMKVSANMLKGHPSPAPAATPAGQAAPAPPAPTTPATPTDFKTIAKYAGMVLGIGAALYFLLAYMGITSLPAIGAVVISLLILIGALRGNPLCELIGWILAGLFSELAVIFFAGSNAILTCIGIFVVWMLALVLPKVGGKRTKAVFLILIIATISIAIIVYNTNTLKGFVSSGSAIQKSVDALGKSFRDMWNSLKTNLPGLFKQGQLEVQRQINIARGDYETGVEAQSTKQLGVFLENLGLTETQVPKDGVVDFYAKLRAESFSTSANAEPLLINLKCYDDATKKEGAVRPQNAFTVEEYESLDIDCLFNARDLSVGSNTLALEASFGFTTSAFLKSYFMDQETIRSYTRQKQDPLDAFQITDKNPTAVYTAGPMRIGMNVGKQPIPLISSNDAGPTLTLTIERAWLDGDLLSLDELSITVPPGLQIDRVSGQETGNACTSSTTQEQVCTFDSAFISKIITDLKKPFTTIKILTKQRDPTKLLGGAPLAIRSFKTDIKYQYRIKKMQTVTVKEGA